MLSSSIKSLNYHFHDGLDLISVLVLVLSLFAHEEGKSEINETYLTDQPNNIFSIKLTTYKQVPKRLSTKNAKNIFFKTLDKADWRSGNLSSVKC